MGMSWSRWGNSLTQDITYQQVQNLSLTGFPLSTYIFDMNWHLKVCFMCVLRECECLVDPDFFFALSSAIRRSICRITRLNMCMDFQKNLMSLVSESVKKGRVHSFGAHLIGDGVLNGKY